MAIIGISTLVDAGGEVIIKSDSSNNWAKVFKREVNNALEYLWYTTDNEGDKLPRGGQIKGTVTYASLELAEAAIPLNYSEVAAPDNVNAVFEANVLPNLMSGFLDITENNTMGLSVFPTTGVTHGAMNTRLDWGDALLYRGTAQTIRSLGLATGFDHNRMFDVATMPLEERYAWNVIPEAYANLSLEELKQKGLEEWHNMFDGDYPDRRKDKNGNTIAIPKVHWDIETPGFTAEEAAAFIEGFHSEALLNDADAVTIFYGKPVRAFVAFWRMSRYWYDGDSVSERKRLYPFMKNVNYQNPSGLVTEYAEGKNIYFNIAYNYPNSPMPLYTSMYKKINGIIQLDSEGERDFIDYGINETQRGVNLHWEPNEGHEDDVTDGNQGPYKNWIHEVFLAVFAPYAHYSSAIYDHRVIAGGNDITNAPNGDIKTCWMTRVVCEGNPWGEAYRPLDRYSAELQILLGFVLTNSFLWWSGWTHVLGFSDNGSSSYPVSNEGQALTEANIDGTNGSSVSVNLGSERQSLALSWYIQTLNRDFGLFSDTDLLLTFTHPLQVQPRAEILGFGRLQGRYAFIVLSEPRFDIDNGVAESMQVIIGNTLNDTTFTRFITAKQTLKEVFTFPVGDYEPKDITIEYTSIKNQRFRVTGDLVYHDYATDIPEVDGCSFPLSLYPISAFCLYQNDVKSSIYRNGSNALKADYDATRVAFMLSTHSITYTLSDPLASSNYIVRGVVDGLDWVKVTQSGGSYSNGLYGNNHPRAADGVTIDGEDCVVYFPIADYDIIMTNTGTVNITMWVLNPDPGTGALDMKHKLAPGATYTYRVYAATMNTQPYYKRALKINNNRDSETDTL